jgi:hypothetical protein
MSSKSPLALVKDGFGDKAKLVDAIEKLASADLWVARINEKKGLGHVSNAKLLRLHATFSEVKEKFGTREKLIDAVLELQGHTKDTGVRQRLSTWPVPRLYDVYQSAKKRSGGQSEAATAAKAPQAEAKSPTRAAPKPKAAKKAAKTAAKAPSASRKPAKKKGAHATASKAPKKRARG